jgi:hypothetical protein
MSADQLCLFWLPPCRGQDVRCVDCRVDTIGVREFYRVHDSVRPLAELGGCLCIGCLEERIGRRLTPADFTDAPINRFGGSSARLRSRLGRDEPR